MVARMDRKMISISSSSSNASLRTRAELVKLDFQELYLKWGGAQPPRTGLHASSLLVSDAEWCPRKHVLSELFPDEAVQPDLKHWQWKQQDTFLHGWELHRKWQYLFKHFGGNVVVTHVEYGLLDWRDEHELDRTHYDAEREIYFSPDAILDIAGEHHVVEIKGVNHNAFESLTDSLHFAMSVCETVEKAVVQANLYMHLLELKHAVILIENKNNQDFKVWITEYNRDLALPYIQRAYQVKGGLTLARAHNTYPPRLCATADDSLARKCAMCDTCFALK